jgi:opacity protein-like surface antigen
MRCRSRWMLLLPVVILTLPLHAAAESRPGWPRSVEGFVDLFLGAAMTQRTDVELRANLDPGILRDLERRTGELSLDTSLIGGERVGFWWDFVGANLDVAYFKPDPERKPIDLAGLSVPGFTLPAGSTVIVESELQVLTVGLNAMLRLQLVKDAAVPQGRLQPYVFAGPTLFISIFDTEARFIVPGVLATNRSASDTEFRLGVTGGAGLTFMFTPSVGAFAEYRFTHAEPEFDLSLRGVGSGTLRFPLSTHHGLGGLTFRF